MIEYEDIFNDRFIMLKTIPMEANITMKSEEQRLCSTCKYELTKFKCSSIGKIKFPDSPYCSWWKEKSSKPKTKRCSYCGELKTIDKFYRNKANPDGHQGKCIKCALIYGTEYQRKNNENNTTTKIL